MINRMIEYDKQNSTSVLKYTKKLFISSGILHYDVHTAGGYSGGVLKAATCLWILLFLNNRFVVHFCMCQQLSFICTSVLKYIKKKCFFCPQGTYIYDVHMVGGRGCPEICHVSVGSIAFKQQIYCSFLQMEGGKGQGVTILIFFADLMSEFQNVGMLLNINMERFN